MTQLKDFIRPRAEYAKSVHIERDLDHPDALTGYLPTQRSIELTHSILSGLAGASNIKAWSVTGPYGSGKSSFVQFLSSTLSSESNISATALNMLRKESAPQEERASIGNAARPPVVRCLATAQREPVTATVARAILNGIEDRWGRRSSAAVAEIRELVVSGNPSAAKLLAALSKLREKCSVLLVIDELGKNLEAAAEDPSAGDLFLLQQIAESFGSSDGHPSVIVTLQHLSFEDYAGALPEAYRREWRKVQGRFQDVPFEISPVEFRQLISRGLIHGDAPKGLEAKISRASRTGWKWLTKEELTDEFPGKAEFLAATFPLHPAVVLVLPELCFRLGQHDRTLFSFLSGASPHALPAFLERTGIDQDLTWLALDEVYMFFLHGLGSGSTAGLDLSRLLEVQSRIREAEGLSPGELKCLRSLAVLNLVADRGALRASRSFLRFCLSSPTGAVESADEVIESLEKKGLLTYVQFADEFRVWRGTDFDVKAAVAHQKEQLSHLPLSEHLERSLPPRPLVAHRHSYETGGLRFFETRYVETPAQLTEVIASDASADGVVALVLAANDKGTQPDSSVEGKPLVVVYGEDPRGLMDLAHDAAALEAVMRSAPEDPVARQEIRRRSALAQKLLRERAFRAFSAGNEKAKWVAKGRPVRPKSEADVSRLLSELCDETYTKTPVLLNEMLNRRELTSQGAKTRRELIEAMLGNEHIEGLGIAGNGPDWAMYQSVLVATGIHREVEGEWRMCPPKRGSGLSGVWKRIMSFFDDALGDPRTLDDLYKTLMDRPYGMKVGAIPVLLLAALQYRSEDVALYQDGSYQPLLTADLFERLVVTPHRFAVKHMKVAGVRHAIFSALGQMLVAGDAAPAVRNQTTLSLVRPLVAFIRSLPTYSLKTKDLSPRAVAVRRALLEAKQPDELLFKSLPLACGSPVFGISDSADSEEAEAFARALSAAVEELRNAYPALLQRIQQSLLEAFGTRGGDQVLREDLRARARQLLDQVIEPRLRSFLFSAATEEFDEEEWLEALGMNLSGRPPQGWLDEDEARFDAQLAEISRMFRRVERLHYDLRDRDQSHEGFHVRRITVTRPDGNEANGIAWVEEARIGQIEALADGLLDEIVPKLNGVDPKVLLSVLSEKLLAESTISAPAPVSNKGVANG
jgi:hypothetical protein